MKQLSLIILTSCYFGVSYSQWSTPSLPNISNNLQNSISGVGADITFIKDNKITFYSYPGSGNNSHYRFNNMGSAKWEFEPWANRFSLYFSTLKGMAPNLTPFGGLVEWDPAIFSITGDGNVGIGTAHVPIICYLLTEK